MSLESDVANLVTQTNALLTWFQAQKNSIAAAVSAAIAAVPNNERTWYVNQLTGDDSAAGTINAPLKTIDKALANTPACGICTVRLQADYVHSTAIVSNVRVLNIMNDITGVKRKLTLTYQSDGAASSLAGFGLPSFAGLGLREVILVLPSPAGVVPTPTGSANILIKTYSSAVTSILSLKLDSCEVQAAADFAGFLMPFANNAAVLESVATSYPSGFGGRYISGVASGTASNTLSNVVTNLATL